MWGGEEQTEEETIRRTEMYKHEGWAQDRKERKEKTVRMGGACSPSPPEPLCLRQGHSLIVHQDCALEGSSSTCPPPRERNAEKMSRKASLASKQKHTHTKATAWRPSVSLEVLDLISAERVKWYLV